MIQIPKLRIALVSLACLTTASLASADNTFSGLYAGGSLGYQAIDLDWETTATYDPSGNPIPPSSAPKESLSDASEAISVFLGYNFMLDSQWLLGAELAYTLSDFEDDISDRIPGLGFSNSAGGSYSEIEAGNGIGLAARAGYLVKSDLMVYGALSIRELDIKSSSTCPADTFVCNPAFGAQSFSSEDTLQGWGLGIGLEKSFGEHFTLRGEYRYVDYGDYEFVAFPYDPASRFGAEAKIDVESSSLEIGGVYRF